MPTVWEDFDVKALPTRSAFPEAQGLFLIFVSQQTSFYSTGSNKTNNGYAALELPSDAP